MDKRRDVARDLARIYQTLPTESLDRLSEILVPMKFAKGEQILKEGEVCRYMYYVYRGFVRQYYFKNGKDLTEHFSYEGKMVICIESFFKQEPTRLLVEAQENTWIYGLPYLALEELSKEDYNIAVFYRKILEVSLIDSQIKADLQRFESAQDRYRRLIANQPEIFRRAALNQIASFLQMTPETLSRVRAQIIE
ncbi:MAG: Crp/Fnr family transcriptional regulator [Bacteroidaceae bacterium]|nr:Crp/Fnr family transcriptional regulator [Bacteroidaceae bacterium]